MKFLQKIFMIAIIGMLATAIDVMGGMSAPILSSLDFDMILEQRFEILLIAKELKKKK